MPLYEYQCEACGQRFEKIQKFSDPNPEACAKCGKGPIQRLLSTPAIQFKGSGWYITDYAGGRSSAASSSSASDGESTKADKGEKSESSSTPAKSESKSDSSSKPTSSAPASSTSSSKE